METIRIGLSSPFSIKSDSVTIVGLFEFCLKTGSIFRNDQTKSLCELNKHSDRFLKVAFSILAA